MNLYEITYTRENGTTVIDRFVAPNEAQARKDFKECYRHGSGTFTSVKLIESNAQATKEQELRALKEIRKIVEGLGPDSYISMAFEGCFEIAEDNIGNDFGDSMYDRWQRAKRDAEHFQDTANTCSAELEKARNVISSLKEKLDSVSEIANYNAKQCDEYRNDAAEQARRADAAEGQVVRLKAKLYDFITAAAG